MQTQITSDIKQKGRMVLNYKNDGIISRYSHDKKISKEDALLEFKEMLKFLYACKISKQPLTPSKEIDEI